MKKNASHPSDDAGPRDGRRIDAIDWISEAQAGPDVLRAMQRQMQRHRRLRWRAAILGTLVVLGGATLGQVKTRRASDAVAAARTAVVRQPLRKALADGSVVELKEGASIKVDFSGRFRRVELREGEAHFQVAKSSRPFVVVAGDVEVVAVGTAFAVGLDPAAVDVLVTEGRVAIGRDQRESANEGPPKTGSHSTPDAGFGAVNPAAHPQAPLLLDAGNRVSVGRGATAPAPRPQAVSAAEASQRLAWRTPRLEFSGTPLADAIPMINAHNRVRITIADPALARVKLSGVLRADNVDTLLELLHEEHGIASERRGQGEIVLRPAR